VGEVADQLWNFNEKQKLMYNGEFGAFDES